MKTLMFAVILSTISTALFAQSPTARPNDFYTTQRYFGYGGRYLGSSRTYSTPYSTRTNYYNSQGRYSGTQVGQQPAIAGRK